MAQKVLKAFFPSVSFSGAGFLGCYHIGVAACLLKHGYLHLPGDVSCSSKSHDSNNDHPPVLLGASAGALICAGIMAGVKSEDSMDIALKLAQITRTKGGVMDVFQPG